MYCNPMDSLYQHYCSSTRYVCVYVRARERERECRCVCVRGCAVLVNMCKYLGVHVFQLSCSVGRVTNCLTSSVVWVQVPPEQVSSERELLWCCLA